MITYHIITLFPESLDSYLNASIIKRAQAEGHIAVKFYNPRDYSTAALASKKSGREASYADRRVDNRPYGGGPGMVMEALPVIRAIEKAVGKKLKSSRIKNGVKIVFFGPAGAQFDTRVAESFKKCSDIVLVCGRYEGIDARVKKAFPMTDISIGPYVLTGGELPALVVIDAVTRRIPGVLGDNTSIEESRIASPDVYTRPEVIEYKKKKYRVPKILLTGHHQKIDEWKEGRKKR
jgi:tRNA (guanine37-N1)-methyltransferase